MRSVSRMTGVSINTVMKFVADFGEVCEAYHDTHVRGVQCKRVQADEIWAFCYSKEKNVPASNSTSSIPAIIGAVRLMAAILD